MSLSSQTLQVNYLTQNEAILLAWEHFPFVPSLPSTQSWRHILGYIFPQGYLPVRYSPPCPRSLPVEKTEVLVQTACPSLPLFAVRLHKGKCNKRNEIVYVRLHSHFGLKIKTDSFGTVHVSWTQSGSSSIRFKINFSTSRSLMAQIQTS